MPDSPDDPVLPQVTRLAAYGVIQRDGRTLLCRVGPDNLGTGLWVLPGGGLEFGEAPEDAAIREVAEETGLEATVAGIPEILSDSGIWDRRSGPVRYHHVRFVYPMTVVGGEERLEVGGSTDAFGWFTVDEVRELHRKGLAGDLVSRLPEIS